MKYLLLLAIIYGAYRISNIVQGLKNPQRDAIDDSDEGEFADYEEIDD